MDKVLVSGASGFISGYLVAELLARGYQVTGVDNFSKYGQVSKSYDDHPHYRLVEGDARDGGLMTRLLAGCDHFVAGAAMIGGISYFHELAYDLLAENERIIAAAFDAAIEAHRAGRLQKITYVSSSMVFEARRFLAVAGGAGAPGTAAAVVLRFSEAGRRVLRPARLEQYRLPYTIVRPFNCVGIGETPGAGDERSCPATCGWP